jgi:hypothetical protein
MIGGRARGSAVAFRPIRDPQGEFNAKAQRREGARTEKPLRLCVTSAIRNPRWGEPVVVPWPSSHTFLALTPKRLACKRELSREKWREMRCVSDGRGKGRAGSPLPAVGYWQRNQRDTAGVRRAGDCPPCQPRLRHHESRAVCRPIRAIRVLHGSIPWVAALPGWATCGPKGRKGPRGRKRTGCMG